MSKKYSNKRKVKMLLWGSAITLFIAILIPIRKTASMYSDYNSQKNKLESVAGAPRQIDSMTAELRQIEQLISNKDTSEKDVRQKLMEDAGDYCNQQRIVLQEYPHSVFIKKQDYLVETNIVTLEGPFSTLLNFVYLLETGNRIGKVVSVDFQRKVEPMTKKEKLFARIYVQNLRKDEKNN
ncbi:MAG: hypothetical protein V2A54_11085 [Bacteroidota bacterium]